MSTKLFVGNLSYDTTENELQDLFSAHGKVAEVNILQDKMTGRPRGFGFVTMENANEAQAAITALNGTQVGGRALTVNEARPREGGDRPSGGGGRREGRGGGGYGREGREGRDRRY